MAAYYNEIDPFAAAWLRELITAGVIADGTVDERSIADVRGSDLAGFDQCHFFAGIGGWSFALRLAGWPDDRPVWTGSCPCQPFSSAGRGDGADDSRHLWPTWVRLVEQCRPLVVFGEQVASVDGLAWFDRVATDLESLDYAVGAADLPAAGVGAWHKRSRLWFVADASSDGREAGQQQNGAIVGDASCESGLEQSGTRTAGIWADTEWIYCRDGKYRPIEPGTFPLAHGVPGRVGRLRGYGNAIVPPLAAEFIKAYLEAREEQLT